MSSPRAALVCLYVLLFLPGCAEPPHKEMNQAQGAIDTARAAGADRYAPEEYEAAEAALVRSYAAVDDRDYRLALNYAIDARERAQESARLAADQKSRVRSRVDETLRRADAMLADANSRLEQAQQAKVPARELAPTLKTIAALDAQLVAVRASIQRDQLLEAQASLDELLASRKMATSGMDAATAARAAPRPPRRAAPRKR
jgi:hypothetical protein